MLYMQSGLHPAPLFKPAAFESNPVHPAPKAAAGGPAQRGDPAPTPVMPKISHALRTPGERSISSHAGTVIRGLSEFGFGQIKPTGTLDPDTQRAIAEFERQRNLPITGRLSEEFIRQLSAVTGRMLQ